MRKLASIQRIADVQPIPDADKVDCVTVLGWKCVVKKGEFKVGDLVVYVEADSMLPFNPWTGEDLPDKPLRLKTVRMKKQISQGLVLSPSLLPRTIPQELLAEGVDVSDTLGITKYEPPPLPAALAGLAKGLFPSFLVKTDETRIQAYPAVIDRWRTTPFAVTEKLDGSSTSYYWRDLLGDGAYAFGACSRNLDLQPGNSAQWTVAAKIGLQEALTKTQVDTGRSYAVQGELAGPNIQGNRLGLPEVSFFAFNVFDIGDKQFLSHDSFMEWCAKFNLPTVPVINGNFSLGGHSVDTLVKFVTMKSKLNPNAWIEGGVFRPLVEQRDPDLGRLSFKVINPEFLLKHGE